MLGVAATHPQRKEGCILLRLTRHTWLCLGILVATLLASLGPATTTPARAAARTPAPAPPSATIWHSHLPPRGFVPTPLRQAGNDTMVRFHGRPILIPAHAHLIPALHALLMGAHTSGPSAPRGRIAPLHIQQRHIGLSMPRAPRALATSSAAPSPPPIVSIDTDQGRFFPNPTDSGGFTRPTAPPLFTAQFPTIDFNPPVSAQVSCRNSTGVNAFSYDVIQYDAADRVAWTLRNLAPVQRDSQGQPIIPATPPAYDPQQPDADVATLYGYDGLGRTVLVTQTGILTGTFNTATQNFSEATTRVTRIEYDALDHPITMTLNYRPDLPALPDANVQLVRQYDTQGNVTWQRNTLSRWTQTQYDALNRPVTTTVNYENGDPLTVDPANQSWTNGNDTDLVSVTRYRPDNSIAQTIANDVDGVFTTSEPITDPITQYAYDGQGRVITTTVNADPATVGTRSDTNRFSVNAYDPLTGTAAGPARPARALDEL